ncbi:MAG: glycosyltransferase family 2 protein [Nitrospirales bacterium]|nr:glycosyltransferase family 2 protein [Nitrospirales bacterium]
MESSIVVVTFNSRSVIRECLAPLADLAESELIVVDNASTDDTLEVVARDFPEVMCQRLPENKGFGNACNQAAAKSAGKCLVFLNPDAVASPEAVRILYQFLNRHPRAGIAGGRLIDEDNQPLASMGDLPSLWRMVFDKFIAPLAPYVAVHGVWRTLIGQISAKYRLPGQPVSVDWVSGAALCCRRSTWETIGGFDDRFFLYYEDVDLCLRAVQAGWEVWHLPQALIRHQSGASFQGDRKLQKQVYYASQEMFFRKHHHPVVAALSSVMRGWYERSGYWSTLARDRIGPPVR